MLTIQKDFIKEDNLECYTLSLDDGQSITINNYEFETLKKYITKDLAPSSKTITLRFDSAINLNELVDNLYYELDRETKYIVEEENNRLMLETEIDFNYDTLDKALEEFDVDCCDYRVEDVKFNY